MLRAYIAQQEAERVEVRAALGLLACRYLRDTSLSEVQQQALTKMQAWAKEGL
jgi:hypothetical protein